MSNSKLATYVHLSPNCTKPRTQRIMGVAIHCTAGGRNKTARATADMGRFTTYDRKHGASSHYIVGGDGSIAQACLEENRAWCTTNPIDHYIVTIEVASDADGVCLVNTVAITALIELLTDICKRNGIPKLLWQGKKTLMGQWSKQNMVVHRWTTDKACPGDYLYSLHGKIADAVNANLAEAEEEEETVDVSKLTNEQCYEIMARAMEHADTLLEPVWSRTDGHWAKATEKGVVNGNGPERPIKRDEVITILGRLGLL